MLGLDEIAQWVTKFREGGGKCTGCISRKFSAPSSGKIIRRMRARFVDGRMIRIFSITMPSFVGLRL